MSVEAAFQVGTQLLTTAVQCNCLCDRVLRQQLRQASGPAVLLNCVCVPPCAGFGGRDCDKKCSSGTFSEGGCLAGGTDACLLSVACCQAMQDLLQQAKSQVRALRS